MNLSPSPPPGRGIPTAGLASLVVGTAMLLWFRTVQDVFQENWNEARTVAWLVVAALAVLWGANAVFERWGPGSRNLKEGAVRRHRIRLLRPGLVYLVMMAVMLVGSLLGRSNMLMLMFALLAGPFVVNGWIPYAMLRRIRVTRQAPRAALAGEPVVVEIVFENRKLLLGCWVVVVRDMIAGPAGTLEPEALLVHVPPRGRRAASYEVRLRRRGRHSLGPLHVSSRFPMGLVERGLTVASSDEILVYPKLGRVSPQWKRQRLFASELVDRRTLRRGLFDDEFHAIREYRHGDNPRAIHWRSSARQSQLMVREFDQSREPDLFVLLDLWASEPPDTDELLRVELAISFAATLCVEQMRHSRDARIQLAVAGSEAPRHWEGRSGPASVESLLELLATAEPTSAADGLAALRRIAAERSSATARSVLVTTRPAEAARAAFAASSTDGRRAAHAALDPLVVEADPAGLSAFFTLETETPSSDRSSDHSSD